MDESNRITMQRRQLAVDLATCPGWTDWALPKIRKLIQDLEASILSDDSLTAEMMMRKKDALRALKKDFLGGLYAEAAGSFQIPAPAVKTADDLAVYMPDPAVIETTLSNLEHRPVPPDDHQQEQPPEENTDYSPFGGDPRPLRRPGKPETKP